MCPSYCLIKEAIYSRPLRVPCSPGHGAYPQCSGWRNLGAICVRVGRGCGPAPDVPSAVQSPDERKRGGQVEWTKEDWAGHPVWRHWGGTVQDIGIKWPRGPGGAGLAKAAGPMQKWWWRITPTSHPNRVRTTAIHTLHTYKVMHQHKPKITFSNMLIYVQIVSQNY